ncbi:hypothetical protein MNBD_PLANCTO02-214 [hydrothermal vent metagenome]|uniref:peptidylprolyl isomerase n=1 Tax=hydrothermal vent metagenome TaxID=652676 RepID=A0A3B1DUM5_9ZZZZ
MGEGTHTPSVKPQADTPGNKTTNNKQQTNQWKYLIAGTAGAILIAGALFQVYRTRGVNAAIGRAKVASQSANAPKNMARVGDSLIAYDAVAKEAVARYGKEILDTLIKNEMIQQACREKGIVVTQAEVDKEVLKIAKKFNLDPANWYQMLISERNVSKRQYQRDVILPMLALKKLARADTKVSQEDLRKAFVRDYGERVKVRMIMMDKLSTTESASGIKDIWNELVNALPNTSQADTKKTEEFIKKFEQLAQRHSIEPTSRALGGQIPPIPKYAGNGKIENAAFRLNKGELSPIIQVRTGTARFVILYCEGRTTPSDNTDFDDVREILTERIKEEKVQISIAKIFNKIKEETEVQNFFTGTSTGGVKQTSFSHSKSANYARPRRTTSRN